MVGRCADYALSEYKDCFSVFVHADTDWRINRLSQKHNKTAKEAKDMINKTDKSRSSYYNYYTNKKWGAASSYNLCVDSSKLGIDGAAKAIIQAIEIFDSIKINRIIFYRYFTTSLVKYLFLDEFITVFSIHSRLPAAMEFWLVCLGIVVYEQ